MQDIHYNAKGQRETIWYGNDTKVVYYCDALTQRLRRQATRKRSGISAWTDLADVYYYYDAVGNITRIRDEAADSYFTGNTIVEPLKDYTYDALYRLIKAKGREQISNATYGTDDDFNDGLGSGTANSNALQSYMQYYSYDGAGNILSLSHDGASAGDYTRNFNYGTNTNRLTGTTVNSTTYSYTYDARGNMTSMPHLSAMGWNSNSELSMVVAGTVNGYYQYSGGNRIRKVIEKSTGVEERIYLGSYERYRKYDTSGTKVVERDTVHINDDTGRIAMLEVRTEGTDTVDGGTEQSLTRFIYSNHLQSSSLELNESGGIISYEEYHPYGTTAYQSKSSTIAATAKRYRYTGKERDEESGLNYHGARYYAPWLCRWTAVDPLESKYAGMSPYNYGFNDPVSYNDPTGQKGEKGDKKNNTQPNSVPEKTTGVTVGTIISSGMDNPQSNLIGMPSPLSQQTNDVYIEIGYFMMGAFNAWASDNIPANIFGFGRQDPMTMGEHAYAYALGQLAGDIIALDQGIGEITGGAVGGAVFSETVIAIPLGVAAVAHGISVTSVAGINLVKDAQILRQLSADPVSGNSEGHSHTGDESKPSNTTENIEEQIGSKNEKTNETKSKEKFPDANELAKEFGISKEKFHKSIKPELKKDFSADMKKIKSTNPDIGFDEQGNIVLRNPQTGQTINTKTPLKYYKN